MKEVRVKRAGERMVVEAVKGGSRVGRARNIVEKAARGRNRGG